MAKKFRVDFQKTKLVLMKTPLYNFWQLLQRFRGRTHFDFLIHQIHQSEIRERSLPEELAVRCHNRRKLSSIPRVLALGHESWEQHGLWPSFRRLSNFDFFSVGMVNEEWNNSLRYSEGMRILALIDEMDRSTSPIELVFIYADSSFLAPEMLQGLADRNIWTVFMGLDDKHKLKARSEMGMIVGQELIAPLVDIYWTTWKSAVPYLWKIGARPVYLAEGADPEFHQSLKLNRDIDVLFLGARYGVRKTIIDSLCKYGFNVQPYGKGWPNGYVSFKKSIELINRSKIVLGVGGVGHLDEIQHLKGRDFEVPMCGALYLTSYNPELTDWYHIGREILCYSSPQNCAEILEVLLRDEHLQESIRRSALTRAQQDHTWESRISFIFKLINGVF